MLSTNTILQTRYLIIQQMGQGGMGTVYEAIDQRLDSTVAIKETFFTDEKLLKQFEREARLLARLHHPALPRVSDHFAEASGQFLVMQFISGKDLAEMLMENDRPFSTDQVLNWADQLLDALDYLHSQELPIIHRDIKPQNLKLTPRGQIILLDFGLAKGFAGQISRITTSGSIFGYTPNYAPLEQIHGTGTDARSDLYSLAATLYHLLTGVVPVDALARLTTTVTGKPDPLRLASEVNKDVPLDVSSLLHNAMAHNPDERPRNAAVMRKSLRDIRQEGSSPLVLEPKPNDFQPGISDPLTDENQTSPVIRDTVGSPDFKKTPNPLTPTMQVSPFSMDLFSLARRSPVQPEPKSRRSLWLISGIAILVIGIALVLFAVYRTSSSSDKTVELSSAEAAKQNVAAAVNGKRIMLTDVDRSVNQQAAGQNTQLSDLQRAQARTQALSSLIDQEVLFQRAKKEGLLPSEDEITQALVTQKSQSGMTEEEFQKLLTEQNHTNESVRDEVRKSLAIQKLQDKNNGKIGWPNDKEVADFYNSNKDQFINNRGVELSMIVADPAENDGPNDTRSPAEAKVKIESIYQQLKSGGDFAELARARSEDSSKTKGGEIGFATEDDLHKNAFPKNLIRDFFDTMQVGNISAPVSFSSNRWFIFKLMRRQLQTENLTLDSPGVRKQITETILSQHKDLANAALLENAKNESRIINYLASTIN